MKTTSWRKCLVWISSFLPGPNSAYTRRGPRLWWRRWPRWRDSTGTWPCGMSVATLAPSGSAWPACRQCMYVRLWLFNNLDLFTTSDCLQVLGMDMAGDAIDDTDTQRNALNNKISNAVSRGCDNVKMWHALVIVIVSSLGVKESWSGEKKNHIYRVIHLIVHQEQGCCELVFAVLRSPRSGANYF